MEWIQATLVLPKHPNPDTLSEEGYAVTLALVEIHLAEGFGGYTRWECKGAERQDDGSVIHEDGYVYLFDFSTEDRRSAEAFEDLRGLVKRLLGQRAVFLSYVTLEDAAVQ